MSERDRRIADNERRFRVFNDAVLDVGAQLATQPGFACECGDDACRAPLRVPIEDYARLRRDAQRFAVLPGHDRPDVERVVERHDAYLFVEKIAEGAEIAG